MTPAELERFYWRVKAEARRDSDLCPDCGSARGERSRCPEHLAVHAARAREARKTQKKRPPR
jgi:hypothetical protein